MQSPIIKIDTLKPIGTLVDLTGQFNARVGDAYTPITIQWTEGGNAKNLDGLHPVFEAVVGQGHVENNEVLMNDDAVPVRWVGDQSSIRGYGQTILKLPPQVFSKSGLCYGYLALENDQGVRETSVDIWFKVLGGVYNMGLACNYFITDFQKALAKAKGDVFQALDEIKKNYELKIQSAENAIDDAENAIDDNVAALKNLKDSVGAIQAQIDAGNIVTLTKHNTDIDRISKAIEDKLAQMSLEPEAFENETALKAKYPAGASGLMVTVDTGHKWLWINGAWKDCGVYQGKGIANRSVDSLAIKERTLALRTSQSTPWIVDLQNHKLTVSDYSYIYDDTAHQIPKGDYLLSDFTTVYLGYDAVNEQLNSYQHYTDIPESSYYVGAVDFGSRKAFLGFDWVAANKIPNGKVAFSSKIDREHLPAPITGMVSLLPWTVNTYGDTPTITVNGYTLYLTKGSSFSVQTGTYQLDKIDGGAYYLYLDLDYDKLTATIKATSHPFDIPINDPWIGFVETNSHVYRIFDNSDNLSYNFDLVTPGKFTVDFDKGILYVPVFWQTVNPLKVWVDNPSVAEIKFDKSQGALFVGIDPSQSDVQKMIVIDSNRQKIQDTYRYIGWISINTQEYDFGKYGSTHDLATQPWIDKKVACLGDSITEGDSGEGSLIDSYVPKLKKYIGTTAQNFGKSGALITKKTDDDISFVNRVGAIKGQDVVTIFGGINDFQWNAPLGTMADGADKPTTFYGALKYVITTLSANNPKAKLMLITPMKTTKFQYHTYDSDGNLMQNANGNTQLDFVNAIKQVGEYYSIPVLDMYSNSNYSPYLPSQVGHDNFTADGLHPTAHGYERIARTIGHAINNL